MTDRIEEIVLASTNHGKLAELQQMLAKRSGALGAIRVRSLDEFAPLAEAPEDEATLEENARSKALYYAGRLERWVVADDSGLEVDALNGAPGVMSARFAARADGGGGGGGGGGRGGREEQDAANNAKLLGLLAETPEEQRTARFRCCLCLARPGKVVLEAKGAVEGEIGHEPRGRNGFGYDPIFFVPDKGKMVAELGPDEKNAISHRGRALRALCNQLEAILAQQ